MRKAPEPGTARRAFWATPVPELFAELGSGPLGLSAAEAARRLADSGPVHADERAMVGRLRVLWRQAKSPLLLLLVFAALVAGATGAWTEAGLVLGIVGITIGIGYGREYHAERAAAALASRIDSRAVVIRDGRDVVVPRRQVMPGDLVRLAAGGLVPADGILVEASDLFVGESALSGESFPAAKSPGVVSAEAPLNARTNAVFLGTDVRSGSGCCLVVRTGAATELGAIAGRLARPAPESDFDRGLRRFGYFLTVAMLMLVLMVFAAHVLRGRPPVEMLLFSIALAVGLSPELMPAILSVNLARGARLMATRGVLVRRLNAIENLGSMDVLCTDKTGTLTEGVVTFAGSYDTDGVPSDGVRAHALANAAMSTGPLNPLDEALLAGADRSGIQGLKLAEIPFDFSRKRVSVVVARAGADDSEPVELITKGAAAFTLAVCTEAGGRALDDDARRRIESRVAEWSRAGTRVVALASRKIDRKPAYDRDDEQGLNLEGFLTFLDRPKADAARAVADLARLRVRVALITGDNRLVAAHVAAEVGLRHDTLLTGADLRVMDEAALWRVVDSTDVFAEVDPNQKERILRAFKRNAHVVGFLGDGVNDALAMHVADTSLSVDTAVDVAREAADFVLLERDLDVIRGGIIEGRRTFANTRKYILITMSANLGNMLSMAAASMFLPFLPMTAAQILLTNLLSDLPAFGLADDRVDSAMIAAPPRWDVRMIGRFMTEFGLLSSAFDLLTFALLLRVFHASAALFQTGWFVESLLTELVVALVVRTAGPCWRSRPGTLLIGGTAVVTIVTLAAPFLPGARLIGLVPLPLAVVVSLAAVTTAYAAAVEFFKIRLYRRLARSR